MFSFLPFSKKNVIVSFEDDAVRVIYGSNARGALRVDDSLTLKSDQFDSFIENERAKNFTVVKHFKDFFQETFLIPSVKKKFIKNLIETEIRKKISIQDFSYLYSLSKEKIVENRKMKKAFVFVVRNDELRDIVERFHRHGKRVSAIYPDIYVQAEMVKSCNEGTALCVSESGLNKNLFLVKDGQISFIRSLESDEIGLNDFDIENINMTGDYLWQTLRTTPSRVILLGSVCFNYNATKVPMTPAASFLPPVNIAQSREFSLGFISPISALFGKKELTLLPVEYKSLYMKQALIVYATVLFVLLSVTGIGSIANTANNIMETKKNFRAVRNSLPTLGSVLNEYDTKLSELDKYKPEISYSNKLSSAHDFQKLLYDLSSTSTTGLGIDSIDLNINKNVFESIISGSIVADNYETMEKHYQNFLESLNEIEGFRVIDHNINLERKYFRVEGSYR